MPLAAVASRPGCQWTVVRSLGLPRSSGNPVSLISHDGMEASTVTTSGVPATRAGARTLRRLGAGVLAALLVAGLAACGGGTTGADEGSRDAASSTTAAAALTITDPWVKAADSGMTAAFGTLHNDSGSAVRIVSAASDAAPMVELHEVVVDDAGATVMEPVEGGFVIPADGELELAPGGFHIMLMGMTDPIEPGEPVKITLTADDGSELTFTAPARSFDGADETYQGDSGVDSRMDLVTPTP
jgi:periplasmic copper chaperone A